MELIILSGSSGSGKSVALRALEDIGYYCIDNLPFALFPQFSELLLKGSKPVAISLDIRNLPTDKTLQAQLLKQIPRNIHCKIIFLETQFETLICRYSDSRRYHPLSARNIPLDKAIILENELLLPLKELADFIIDTTTLSTHDLAKALRLFLKGNSEKELQIIVESFGFKYGIPMDADYVFDVRFLPNPHWIPELREYTGLQQPVISFLEKQREVNHFISNTCHYLEQWLPYLKQNNRSYLTIAIGCTGGKHRSVYIAEKISESLKKEHKNVLTRHKTLHKEINKDV